MADMGEIEEEPTLLMYRPYIFLSRVDGKWNVNLDWEDCYQGYENGFDFNPFPPADLGLRAYIEEGHDFLGEFLSENADWDTWGTRRCGLSHPTDTIELR